MSDRQCPNCDGVGSIEVDFEGAPRSAWESLPPASRVAYDSGLVEFTEELCSMCQGNGAIGSDDPADG